jgi:hypothetical protein
VAPQTGHVVQQGPIQSIDQNIPIQSGLIVTQSTSITNALPSFREFSANVDQPMTSVTSITNALPSFRELSANIDQPVTSVTNNRDPLLTLHNMAAGVVPQHTTGPGSIGLVNNPGGHGITHDLDKVALGKFPINIF